MATIKQFETAALIMGYHLTQFLCQKSIDNNNNVNMAYGSIQIGNVIKQVRWNNAGRCFSRSNARMEKYDLKL